MRNSLLLISLLMISGILHAQETITGKVVDAANGAPLVGASVKIRSAKTGTSTDNEGTFRLKAKPDDILEVSFIGYTSQSFPLHNQLTPTIALYSASSELSEI